MQPRVACSKKRTALKEYKGSSQLRQMPVGEVMFIGLVMCPLVRLFSWMEFGGGVS